MRANFFDHIEILNPITHYHFSSKLVVPCPSMETFMTFVGDPANVNIRLLGFYSPGDGAEGVFVWDASVSKTLHDGGVIIDPLHTAVPGSLSWYSPENNSLGCWVRAERDLINVKWFGALGNQTNDDTYALQAAINAHNNIYIPSGTYTITSPLTIKTSDKSILGDLKRPVILNTGTSHTLVIGTDTYDTLDSYVSGIRVSNLILRNANLTSPNNGLVLRQTISCWFRDISVWGHEVNLLTQGIKNTTFRDCSFLSLTGSSYTLPMIIILPLYLTNATLLSGFTTKFYNCNAADTNKTHSCLMQISTSDYTVVKDFYFGASIKDLLIEPVYNDSKIVHVDIVSSYFDGVSAPSETIGVTINAPITLTGNNIGIIRFLHCHFGQLFRGLILTDLLGQVTRVQLIGCHFNYITKNAVYVRGLKTAGTILQVLGCFFSNWDLLDDSERAINIDDLNTLIISLNMFKDTDKLGIYAVGIETLNVIGNTFLSLLAITGGMVAYTNITNTLITNNTSDNDFLLPDVNSSSSGTFTPTVLIGGSSSGITLTVSTAVFYRESSGFYMILTLTITSKGVGTGNVTISGLPYTALNDVMLSTSGWGLNIDSSLLFTMASAGSTILTLYKSDGAGGRSQVDNTDIEDGSTIVISGYIR